MGSRRFRTLLQAVKVTIAFGFILCLDTNAADLPPVLDREMRAVWVATVANIDWPSKPGLSTEEQQAELRQIVDHAERLKLNCIVFQVRTACDAMYESRLEPWSEYLTGRMGLAPEPFYDPLSYMIELCHAKGIELHAWFNPFRARHPKQYSPASDLHVSKHDSSLVRKYGAYEWLDPGLGDAQKHSTEVILDVVRRYDIDGVHLDDYFYPYKVKRADGRGWVEFPDDQAWNKYQASGGKLSREDRRRENINYFVYQLYNRIKREKRWVKFGISPFGIWRPENPPGIKGLDTYDTLYADARKWLHQGWLDYIAPQLYWSVDARHQGFMPLMKWWSGENRKDRVLVPGLAASNVYSGKWAPDEVARQVMLSRRFPGSDGVIYYSNRSIRLNEEMSSAIGTMLNREPCLPPQYEWLDSDSPERPKIRSMKQGDDLLLVWNSTSPDVSLWLYQSKTDGRWTSRILPLATRTLRLGKGSRIPERLSLTAVDRCGNLSVSRLIDRDEIAALWALGTQ